VTMSKLKQKYGVLSILMIVMVFGVSNVYLAYKSALPKSGDYSEFTKLADSDIVLVTRHACGFCDQARNYLVLHEVKFEEIVLEKDSYQQVLFDCHFDSGFVPVLLSYNQSVTGFNEEKMATLIEYNN